jgi:23S rRNA pseudouridine2457 synthase
MFRYFKIYKPYGMLSQFTPEAGHDSLSNLDFKFSKDVYPVGRLDHDSEGLLILTNETSVNKLLLAPGNKIEKTYWVEVEGELNDEAVEQLQRGIKINMKGIIFQTAPAKVRRMNVPDVESRNPPVNYKKHPVTSWIEIKITEGKNRQVRKMTAKVGHPALRLIRFAVGKMSLKGMNPGTVTEIGREEIL